MVHGPATLPSRAVKTRIVERITIALGDVFLPLHGARPSFIVALWRSPRFRGRCLRGSLLPQLRGIMNERGKPFSAASINSMLNA
jgi:hypothetical protein